MTTAESLKAIIPGKTYPSEVTFTEQINGKPDVVKICMNSFIVGMYCAVYVNGQLVCQNGDYNNKRLASNLKKDIEKVVHIVILPKFLRCYQRLVKELNGMERNTLWMLSNHLIL